MNALLGAVMLVTAYSKGCGDSGLTFYGLPAGPGTISAPRSIPAFTRLQVEQYGVGVVTDRGPAITEGRLDVWLPTCAVARQWGRRWVRVWTVPPPEPPAITVELDPAGVQATPEPSTTADQDAAEGES